MCVCVGSGWAVSRGGGCLFVSFAGSHSGLPACRKHPENEDINLSVTEMFVSSERWAKIHHKFLSFIKEYFSLLTIFIPITFTFDFLQQYSFFLFFFGLLCILIKCLEVYIDPPGFFFLSYTTNHWQLLKSKPSAAVVSECADNKLPSFLQAEYSIFSVQTQRGLGALTCKEEVP